MVNKVLTFALDYMNRLSYDGKQQGGFSMSTPILSSVAIQDRSLSRHPVVDRLSWRWLLVAIMVLALGALAGGRKW